MIAARTKAEIRCDEGDRGEGPERVGLKQQAPQCGALEHGRCLGLGGGVGGRSLGESLGLGRELRVGQPATDLLEVDRNEVICVDLCLLARHQWLPGVLRHCANHRWGDLSTRDRVGKSCLGREDDLLLGQLVVHVGVGEAVAPHEENARHHQDDHHHRTSGAGDQIEYLSLHRRISCSQ